MFVVSDSDLDLLTLAVSIPNKRRLIISCVAFIKEYPLSKVLLFNMVSLAKINDFVGLISYEVIWAWRIIEHYQLCGTVVVWIRLNNDARCKGEIVSFVGLKPLFVFESHGVLTIDLRHTILMLMELNLLLRLEINGLVDKKLNAPTYILSLDGLVILTPTIINLAVFA